MEDVELKETCIFLFVFAGTMLGCCIKQFYVS